MFAYNNELCSLIESINLISYKAYIIKRNGMVCCYSRPRVDCDNRRRDEMKVSWEFRYTVLNYEYSGGDILKT